MTISEFEEILKKIDSYTDYIYLHVKGEPLLHPNLKEILKLSEKYHKKVTITTNGTLLEERISILKNSSCIRQMNISLHSENRKKNYLEEVFEAVDQFPKNIQLVYRLWTLENNRLDQKSTEIVNKIISYYKLLTETVDKMISENNIRIRENIYMNKANEFLWPEIENEYYQERGYCHALKDQIAILVDGTVVPCCLDGEGVISLGNIYQVELETILKSDRVIQMTNGFKNRIVTEELCRHCNFKEQFNR